jgi:hypothetical protein
MELPSRRVPDERINHEWAYSADGAARTALRNFPNFSRPQTGHHIAAYIGRYAAEAGSRDGNAVNRGACRQEQAPASISAVLATLI